MSYGDDVDKERNRIALERIAFHLDEAMRFCNQLDLSGLGPLEQTEWDSFCITQKLRGAAALCRVPLERLVM